MNAFIFFLTSLITLAAAQSGTVPCTFHDYEGHFNTFGMQLDFSPPYCGNRYSVLNNARIMAVSFMEPGMCNTCIQVFGASGASAYILAVDRKEAAGLDIAGSSFQALFPGSNVLDPQTCSYQVVDPSFCAGICVGSAEECTTGVKNNLPAYLLPPASQNTNGLSAFSSAPQQTRNQPTGTSQSDSAPDSSAVVVTSSSLTPASTPSSTPASTPTSTPEFLAEVVGSLSQVFGSEPSAQNLNVATSSSAWSAMKGTSSLFWLALGVSLTLLIL